MDKICRSVTTLYRIPRISNLNLVLNTSAYAPNHHAQMTNVGSTNSFGGTASVKLNHFTVRCYNSQKPPSGPNLGGAKMFGQKSEVEGEQVESIAEILDREIQEETAELSQHLSTDQFPGFSVETDDADVKLTKQIGDATVTVRFTVSSSLSEWPSEVQENEQSQQQDMENMNTTLVSMPEFQVQISRNNRTLEMSCYFEEMDHEEEASDAYAGSPVFSIDELVMYEGEPKETEFAVSAEYFQTDLQAALLDYLAEHGIDDDFAKNLVKFSTSYEKKQYIGLMKRLRNFVAP